MKQFQYFASAVLWLCGCLVAGAAFGQGEETSPPPGFTYVPPGTFLMGSPQDEPGRSEDETRHEVTLTRGFYISRHAVTRDWWSGVMGPIPPAARTSQPDSTARDEQERSQLPRGPVSWDLAVQFCNALSLLEGLTPAYTIQGSNGAVTWDREADGYRLPTEAEWEFACRAGSQTAFANGPIVDLDCSDPVLDVIGWYCGNDEPPGLKAVGQKPANVWGLHDMHGNIWEWVWDCYRDDYENLDATDPAHDGLPGMRRVLRGGSWDSLARDCRAARRPSINPAMSHLHYGFRPVRTAFDPQVGLIEIHAEPDGIAAPWELSGPQEFYAAGMSDTVLTNLWHGSYTLTWGEVAGWQTPPDQTLTLTPGGTLTYTGTYFELGGPIWYVATGGDDDNPGTESLPFATIQRGIIAAGDGEVVLIRDGVYTGDGNRDIDFLGKTVTVRSASGDRDACIVDAEGSIAQPRVGFRFQTGETRDAVLEELTVTGGYPAGVYVGATGESGTASPTIRGVVLASNSGAGLLAEGQESSIVFTSPRLVSALVRQNGAEGVKLVWATQDAEIDSCTVSENSGDGIGVHGSGGGGAAPFLRIADTLVASNGGDGVVSLGDLEFGVEVQRCQVIENNGWGVSAGGDAAHTSIANTVVQGNGLGGVYNGFPGDRVLQIDNAEILQNEGPGVQIASTASQHLGIADSKIIGNLGDGIEVGFADLAGAKRRRDDRDFGGIFGCVISDNVGMGIRFQGSLEMSFTVSTCLLTGNAAGGAYLGGQAQSSEPAYALQSVTIAANTGPGLVYDAQQIACELGNSLIAFNSGEALAAAETDLLAIHCSDLYGNDGGDWIGSLGDYLGNDGNFAADPLFCGVATGDFTLREGSPCLPGHHPDGADCGLVGALSSGCEAPASLAIAPLVSGPLNCADPATLTFHFAPATDSPPVRGYVVRLLASAELTAGPGDVTVYTVPAGAQVFSDVVENAPGDLTLSYAILGETGQIDSAADLFSLEVHGADTGAGTVQIVSLTMRDLDNQPIAVGVGPPATVIYDCTLPVAVADIVAAPGHEQIEVTWSHDGEDTDHYAVFRGLWYGDTPDTSAYPLYDDQDPNTIPSRPPDLAAAVDSPEWTLAGVVSAGTLAFTDQAMTAGRGVYYYEVFAVDALQNASPPAGANHRATNYWLGDFDANSLVDIFDIHALGEVFGLCSGQPDYEPECDIGPTDDESRIGIPLTDSCVDFEDLMIAAMNFAAARSTNLRPAVDAVPLAWTRLAEHRYALRFLGGEGVQGLRVRAAVPAGTPVAVAAGDLLAGQELPTFLHNIGPGFDVSVAVLGTGQFFAGTGDLFVVETTAEIASDDLVVSARGPDNSELSVVFAPPTGVETPRAYDLSANFPNPFNPATTIRFALPESQRVMLTIYGVDGRRVAQLVDGVYAAGTHEVVWRGRNDAGRTVATGTYFYRLEAGGFRQVRKMVLMK